MYKYSLMCLLLLSCSVAAVDPTAPYLKVGKSNVTEQAGEPQLAVKAIMNKNGTRVAMIGGNLFKVGDQLAGYTLVEIQQFQVTFKRGDEEIISRLFDVDLVKAE